jgi:starch-binding outer membrane protein SusE/F
MKFLNRLGLLTILSLALVTACEKVPDLPFHNMGVEPVLSASAATVAPIPADSNKSVLTLDWTSPQYATDTATFRFIIQVDSTGRNFSKAVSKEVIGDRSASFLAKELNTIMLNFGFEFNKAYDLDMRVISSYNNNNERRLSNTVKVRATPYKIPPKVALPTTGKLYIVGDATVGGWTNPVPTPSQELTQVDETTFGGIFNLVGGKQYLVLPANGSWDNKYSVGNNTLPNLSAGGDFGFNLSDNFPGPSTNGLYKLIMDFQSGKFTMTPFTQQHGLPDSLYIVGDATPGGWNNPVPIPSQRFTRVNSTRFEISSINLTAGKNYLFLPTNGDWGRKYGAVDKSAPNIKLGGPMRPEGEDMPSPDVTGNYKIVVDFINNTYTLVKL